MPIEPGSAPELLPQLFLGDNTFGDHLLESQERAPDLFATGAHAPHTRRDLLKDALGFDTFQCGTLGCGLKLSKGGGECAKLDPEALGSGKEALECHGGTGFPCSAVNCARSTPSVRPLAGLQSQAT